MFSCVVPRSPIASCTCGEELPEGIEQVVVLAVTSAYPPCTGSGRSSFCSGEAGSES